MRLNSKVFALTAGIIWGVIVFISTIWLLITGSAGRTISLLYHFYWGYSFSFIGAVIGLFWGFIDGLIIGYIFSWLYNSLLPKEK